MDEFLRNFGNKIRYYRNVCGYTQELLGEYTDLSTNTINTIENGKSFVGYKTLKKLSKVLNVAPECLFDFKTTQSENDEIVHQITARVQRLNKSQQEQIINIIKTFEN